MQEIRPLNLSHDFDSVRILDTYLNGERDTQTVLDEFENYAGQIYVSVDNAEQITGLVSLSGPRWNQIHMIDHLAVSESQRRKGIGNDLIAFIIKKAREQNARILCVQTATWNKTAIAFYQTLGFNKQAVLLEYIGDKNDMQWLDIDLRLNS